MTQNSAKASGVRRAAAPAQSVAQFLDTLWHPFQAEIVRLREIILAADPNISEAVKWNAPSFCTTEFFATMHLRLKTGTGVILHFGAKKRDLQPRNAIADPTALLQWLADDRAMVTFVDVADLNARAAAFSLLLREWIRHV